MEKSIFAKNSHDDLLYWIVLKALLDECRTQIYIAQMYRDNELVKLLKKEEDTIRSQIKKLNIEL